MHETDTSPQRCLRALALFCSVPAPGLRQCPRCTSIRLYRWGTFAGRRRYRCLTCRRTFSDLTGTPAAYSKRIELWAEYIECMRAALPLRHCAIRLQISLSTAFRWRHAILSASRSVDSTTLRGRVELHELRMAHSRKGSRWLDRPPRIRGARTRDPHLFNTRRVCVVTAHDQHARTYSQHVDAKNLRTPDLCAVLLSRLRKPLTIVSTQGPLSSHAGLARAAGAQFQWAQLQIRDQLAAVLAFLKRIRAFLRPFRGVATKYLDNYLRWHRILEALCV